MVTENGCATNTLVDGWCEDVELKDQIRVDYYNAHVRKVQEIVQSGIPIVGYGRRRFFTFIFFFFLYVLFEILMR
jgi:beta-glucosidase/6-phospho-beta-glucosidase/beta-galactosidase